MDSEYTYQPQYIWKSTTNDGVLPITNFTEEINENAMRKRGKDKDKGKEVGVMMKISKRIDKRDFQMAFTFMQQIKASMV